MKAEAEAEAKAKKFSRKGKRQYKDLELKILGNIPSSRRRACALRTLKPPYVRFRIRRFVTYYE